MRTRLSTVVAAGALLLATAPLGSADGQETRARVERGAELHAAGSVLAPLSPLSTSPGSFDTEVSASAGMAAGAAWWVDEHLGVGLHGVWAPAKLNLRVSEFQGVVPDDLGDADYLAGVAEVLLRLPLAGPAGSMAPFVGLGVGVRRLGLQPVAAPEARSSTDLAGSLAAGATVRLRDPFALRFELRDLISGYDGTETGEGELQNDVLVSVGLSVRP